VRDFTVETKMYSTIENAWDSPPTKKLKTANCVHKMMAMVFADASGVQLFVDFFLISETGTEEHYCKMSDRQKEAVETKRLGWRNFP
jgi:hypothetical protein